VRILLVDDDPISLAIVRALVERRGHACLTASSGDEGLEVYAGERPDAVLTDWSMPGIDGIELCRRIRARAGALRPYLALLSATADPAPGEELASIVDAVLHKPMLADALDDVLAAAAAPHAQDR
jgi:CheY-like chemotaxis protein